MNRTAISMQLYSLFKSLRNSYRYQMHYFLVLFHFHRIHALLPLKPEDRPSRPHFLRFGFTSYCNLKSLDGTCHSGHREPKVNIRIVTNMRSVRYLVFLEHSEFAKHTFSRVTTTCLCSAVGSRPGHKTTTCIPKMIIILALHHF